MHTKNSQPDVFEPTDLYQVREKMYVATDCIIFGFHEGKLKLLVFERQVEPLKGSWSLVGSFVRLDEDLEVAGQRVLEEATGLKEVFMQQLKTYGKQDRDPGYRCISVAQYALIRVEDYIDKLEKHYGAHWFEIDDLPELVLDHDQMVQDALEQLRHNARHRPIGFELLPEKFTIPQLQNLYEAIYQKPLDARNFRKKVLSLNVLEKLEEKDKSGSKRGAFLHKFNKENYLQLLKAGYNFEIF
ncbi:ADP-ribose pyrophosphatase YjhB (NUDIX family) [Gramella sp. Hel_I_59]|uniref:NUDIX hydrolase n=1 Tax=Gramella sp. Hel_I_59 TaxID=1249978 RepID=UPI001151391F|nr:NUDIX domain-containing protein [Gramella sp. Hel_I_59]TQI70303.1 ADP-ribose pyrophosphatase YjhB (NUDIX family) [Gramella sp. Hel_I_59]